MRALEGLKRLRPRRRWILVAALLGAAAFARSRGVAVHRVVGASMAPTLNEGDRLLVNRAAYGVRLPFSRRRAGERPVRRGDVVVFAAGARSAGGQPRALVKRVVGLPGDTVAVEGGALVVNGLRLPSCDAGPFLTVAGTRLVRGRLAVEVLEDRAYLTLRQLDDGASMPPLRVPPGEVFVAGDDRPASLDSRTWPAAAGRTVPIADIEGRVSRLAIGGARDGRLDPRQILTGLRPEVREARLDLGSVAQRIAGCLAARPALAERSP